MQLWLLQWGVRRGHWWERVVSVRLGVNQQTFVTLASVGYLDFLSFYIFSFSFVMAFSLFSLTFSLFLNVLILISSSIHSGLAQYIDYDRTFLRPTTLTPCPLTTHVAACYKPHSLLWKPWPFHVWVMALLSLFCVTKEWQKNTLTLLNKPSSFNRFSVFLSVFSFLF